MILPDSYREEPMERTRLSTKGQVIIPKSLRDAKGWHAGMPRHEPPRAAARRGPGGLGAHRRLTLPPSLRETLERRPGFRPGAE